MPIENPKAKKDDTAFNVAADGVLPIGALADETTPDSVNEGDIGIPRMTLNRILRVVPSLYDGATEGAHSQQANTAGTLLASAARTAAVNATGPTNVNARGVILSVDVTVKAVGGSLTPRLQHVDPVTGDNNAANVWVAAAAITAIGRYVYQIYPGIGSTVTGDLRECVSRIVPRNWTFRMDVGNADSWTYSVGYYLVL